MTARAEQTETHLTARYANVPRKRKRQFSSEYREFPCTMIEELARRYSTLIQDGKRMQTIDLEKWVSEQEKRAKRGVVYAGVLYPKITGRSVSSCFPILILSS